MKSYKAIEGKTQLSGFTTICDGDIFQIGGTDAVIKSSSSGFWNLYRTHRDGRVDFNSPIPGWVDLDGQMAVVRKFNSAFETAN